MVLGLFEGSINIKIEKTSYLPGEIIKGEVTLKLDKPKKAKELRIMFYGQYHTRHGKRRRTERIWVQTHSLSGAIEYPAGTSTYSFEIQIPQHTQPQSQTITLGSISIPVGMSDPVKRATWYLNASLDVSMEFDVNKTMQISLIV